MLLAPYNVPHLSRKWPFFPWLTPFRAAVVGLLLTFVPGYFWGQHLEQERRFAAWQRGGRISGVQHHPKPGEYLLTSVYRVPPAGPGRIRLDESQLSEIISTVVEPDFWDEFGGPGHIHTLPGAIIVTAGPDQQGKARKVVDRMASLPAHPDSLRPIPLFEHHRSRRSMQLEKTLDRITSLAYRDVPLRQILDDIGRRHSVEIVVATKKLEEAAIDLNESRTFTIRNISLRGCLHHFLREIGLTFLIKDDVLQITTPEDACAQLIYVLYPIHDLLDRDPQETTERLTFELTSFIDPDSWDDVGGPGEAHPLADSWLLVSQDAGVQAKIKSFFSKLRYELRSPAWKKADEGPAQRAERAIWSQLDAGNGPELGNLSLPTMLGRLENHLHVPVFLDRSSVEINVPNRVLMPPILAHIRPFSRKLAAMLREGECKLTFRVDHEALLIGEGPRPWLQRLFDVRDLTAAIGGLAAPDDLCQFIRAAVNSESWDTGGGPGAVVCVAGCLAVDNSLDSILEVESLLEFLRKHRTELPRLPRTSWDQRSLLQEFSLEEDEVLIPDWRNSYLKYVREFPFLEWQQRQKIRAGGLGGAPF